MVDKTYEGFEPDHRNEYVLYGVAVLFLVTSCWLAYTLLPSVFESPTFKAANDDEYVPPEGEQVGHLAIVIGNHVAWMLGPFIVSGFLFRMRRLGIYLGVILTVVGVWRFEYIPLSYAGSVLVVVSWGLLTGTALSLYKELD